MMPSSEKTFFGHLDDLTKVLLRAGIIFVVSTVVVFFFVPPIFNQIITDRLALIGLRIITTMPAEVLMTQIKLAVFGGLILGSPAIVPIVWSYVRPALTKSERRAITSALLPSIVLFAAGFVFSYLVILPLAVRFFVALAESAGIVPVWTVSSYVSLVLSLGLAFGVAFELPVFIFVLSRLGIVSYAGLKRSRRYVVVALLIVAAILTPPDVVSQMLLAVPLYLLFEGSLLVVRLF